MNYKERKMFTDKLYALCDEIQDVAEELDTDKSERDAWVYESLRDARHRLEDAITYMKEGAPQK